MSTGKISEFMGLFPRENNKNYMKNDRDILSDKKSGWPEDKIDLPKPEYKIEDGAIHLNLNNIKGEENEKLTKITKNLESMTEWIEVSRKYNDKLNEIVRKELNIPEGHAYGASGAAMTMMEKIGQKHGLIRPVMPEGLKEEGMVDPFENPDPNYGKFMIGKLGNGSFTDTIEVAFDGKGVASNLLSELKATEAKDKGLARLKSALGAGKSDSVWAHYVDSPALKDGKGRVSSVTIGQDGPLAGVILTSGRYQNSTPTGLELFRKIAGIMAG